MPSRDDEGPPVKRSAHHQQRSPGKGSYLNRLDSLIGSSLCFGIHKVKAHTVNITFIVPSDVPRYGVQEEKKSTFKCYAGICGVHITCFLLPIAVNKTVDAFSSFASFKFEIQKAVEKSDFELTHCFLITLTTLY